MPETTPGANAPPPGYAPPRRAVAAWLWLGASSITAFWIVWRSRDDLRLFDQVSTGLVVGMTACHLVSLLTQSERFRLVLRNQSDSVLPVRVWTRLFVRGRLFSLVVPQSGNVYRGLTLRKVLGTPVVGYFAGLATQTWMAIVASLGFASILGWLTIQGDSDARGVGAVQAASVAMLGSALTPWILSRISKFLPERTRRSSIMEKVGDVAGAAGRTIRNPVIVATFLGLVLIGFAASAVGLKIAFAMASTDISWMAAATILAFVHAGNIVSITPGNLGIQELGMAALAGIFEYSLAAGVVASIIVRLSTLVALVTLTAASEVDGVLRPAHHPQ